MEEKFRTEWRNSGVSDQIIDANVREYGKEFAAEVLFGDFLEQNRHKGENHQHTKAVQKQLSKYANLQDGGWWVDGLDPLKGWETMDWGRFKPYTPRVENRDGQDRPIKYESPQGKTSRAIFLRMPGDPNYWQKVQQKNETIYITEGEKKAGALMTLGLPAVSIPGIRTGYRKDLDSDQRTLIPDLKAIASEGRRIVIVFDQDDKQTTRRDVSDARMKLATLLKNEGAEVKMVTWNPTQGKGIDDFLIAQGKDKTLEVLQNHQDIPDPNQVIKKEKDKTQAPQEPQDAQPHKNSPTDTIEIPVPEPPKIPQDQQLLDVKMRDYGRQLIRLDSRVAENATHKKLEGETRYTIRVEKATNTMQILDRQRPDSPILLDRNGKIDHQASLVTEEDVKAFEAAVKYLESIPIKQNQRQQAEIGR